MNMTTVKFTKIIRFCLTLGMLPSLVFAQQNVNPTNKKPVFRVDSPYPTADKPQSKLWFMDGCWWALLPRASGPSLWQRTENGWKEHPEINKVLTGVPGRADVWANDKEIMAVGVGTNSLTVFRLEKQGNKWTGAVLAGLTPVTKDEIETATIVQDRSGHWWVAADAGDKICVWGSADGRQWTKAYDLAGGINKDDISTLAVLPEGIGVIWSDQNADAVKMRTHKDGRPAESWSEIIVIDQGNKTADDHLHAALSPDGTLWLATKNSVDKIGKPQLILRVRSPKGEWRNFPYAILDAVKLPSRPVVIATGDPAVVLSGYTIYNHKNPNLGEIVFGQIDTTRTDILKNTKSVIVPDTTGWGSTIRINDITGPKKPFPRNAPWIILASDEDGQIYEADLKTEMVLEK
jgi:hypothetical protein